MLRCDWKREKVGMSRSVPTSSGPIEGACSERRLSDRGSSASSSYSESSPRVEVMKPRPTSVDPSSAG